MNAASSSANSGLLMSAMLLGDSEASVSLVATPGSYNW